MLVAGKPQDLYDNLASTKKAAKSRDRAIAKESRTALTGSLLERLIAATTLNRIAPSYTHVLQDQIGAGEKTYAMSQRESGLDQRTGYRLKSRVDRSKMGTSSVRPAFMGEADIMMDPYVRAESAEGLAGQGYTGYTGTVETSFGESYDMSQRDLSFANPIDPYVGQEALGALEARQTAQTFGYGGGGSGLPASGGGGRFVQASMGETEGQRIARVMVAKGGIWDDLNGKFVLPNTREYAAVIARQTQAQNPFASGAYEVMYGGGGGAAFDPMDGGGLLQEINESEAYSRLGGVPLAERPIPSDELLAMRMGTFDDPLTPEEREPFRQYIREHPRGTVFEFRNPRAFESIAPMRFGSLDELSVSGASSAQTRMVGGGGGSESQKIAQQLRRQQEREVSLLMTGMVGQVSQDPELLAAVKQERGYSMSGLARGEIKITKKPKSKAKEP
jgi:hypothetical protein